MKLLLELALWAGGFGIIGYNNWQIGIGVFLLIWANNMEWTRRLDINLFKSLDSLSNSYNVIHNKRE
jgi:hypothetical protein